ncbi:MAG: DNA repair protein RecN [Tissierellia bacterium]|nr:DNA repair protein RecN [Tissierellia bacterium]
MLYELYINNFVIIEKEHLQFDRGFNVITGETGSGKSLTLDAINLILGDRAKKEYIGKFLEKTIVEAVFNITDKEKKAYLNSLDLDLEDNNLIITRIIKKNSSTVRINGRIVTLDLLRKISYLLIDIYKQNDNEQLRNKSNYLNLLDKYKFDNETKDLLIGINNDYNHIIQLKKELETLSLDENSMQRELELLKFQLDDIEQIDLDSIDEQKLDREYKKLNVITELKNALGYSKELINSFDYDKPTISNLLTQISTKLEDYVDIDNDVSEFYEDVIKINDELTELYSAMDYYSENLEVDDEKLKIIEEQLEILFNIKRKYGNTIEDVKKYYNEIKEKLDRYENAEKIKIKIKKEIEDIKNRILKKSSYLHNIRKNKALDLEEKINSSIKELGIINGEFKVDFKKTEINRNGFDNIDFLIKTNKGEIFKSLDKTASGGELSRIMLAFKSIYSKYDNIDTLIFDEVDQGISGRTAQVVAEKIADISKDRQIISISHLPQISSLADKHFLVSKVDTDQQTISMIKDLTGEDRIDEISRLIGGVNITKTTYKSAKEMLDMAKVLKKEK